MTIRKMTVYDLGSKKHEFQFTYDPDADIEKLKELTKPCHLAKHPDCEYAMSVDVSGTEYYMCTDGDDAIIIAGILCTLLDDEKLKTVLSVMDCGAEFFGYLVPPYCQRDKNTNGAQD